MNLINLISFNLSFWKAGIDGLSVHNSRSCWFCRTWTIWSDNIVYFLAFPTLLFTASCSVTFRQSFPMPHRVFRSLLGWEHCATNRCFYLIATSVEMSRIGNMQRIYKRTMTDFLQMSLIQLLGTSWNKTKGSDNFGDCCLYAIHVRRGLPPKQ